MQTAPPRSCPRCQGNMLFEEDWYGAYSTCLSCGYVYEFGATAALELETDGKASTGSGGGSHPTASFVSSHNLGIGPAGAR